MTEKKKTTKKATKEDIKDARIAELEKALAQSQVNLQAVVSKANEYAALCAHYEQTMNVLTGRIQEMRKTQ